MSKLGTGVMIHMLGGNEDSVKAWRSVVGQRITALELSDNELRMTVADGTKIALRDDGQSCCETRYMRTDADLPYYVGAVLLDAEVANAPAVRDEYGAHEVAFLNVKTDRGVFTMSNHNEHNGYYGGFSVIARQIS